jgi:hypothetical protein
MVKPLKPSTEYTRNKDTTREQEIRTRHSDISRCRIACDPNQLLDDIDYLLIKNFQLEETIRLSKEYYHGKKTTDF